MLNTIAYSNICAVPKPKDFLGIAADRDDENAIITLSKNVIIIKVGVPAPVRSWSVIERLSSKVIYDKKSKNYVGVFGSCALRTWTENSKNINNCKKIKFKKKIAHLISTEDDSYVLFIDGTCKLLSEAIQSRKDKFEKLLEELDLITKYKLSDPNIINLCDGHRALVYFKRQIDNDELEMILVPLDGIEAISFKLNRGSLDVRLAGYAIIERNNAAVLMTIWSDQRIFLLKLNETVQAEQSPGYFFTKITSINVDMPVAILGISQNSVVIYGADINEEGSSLILYNTQFKLVQAKQTFKVYFNCSHLWNVGKHILLTFGQNLAIISYSLPNELVSELIGKQIRIDEPTQVWLDDISEEETLEEYINFSKGNESYMENVPSNNHQSTQEKLTPLESVHKFNCEFSEFYKMQLHSEILYSDNTKICRYAYNGDCFNTKEIEYLVQGLENLGMSEHEVTAKILSLAMETDLLEDIAICLQRYSNIPEKSLVKTLKYILNKQPFNAIAQQIETICNSYSSAESSIHQQFDVKLITCIEKKYTNILNALFACSFESTVLSVNIRHEIEYTKVIFMLEYLYALVNDREEVLGSNAIIFQGIPFELNLLRWFDVLLKAYFQEMSILNNVPLMDVLLRWHKLFVSYRKEKKAAEEVAALIYTIVEKSKIIKRNNYSKWYSIENVYF